MNEIAPVKFPDGFDQAVKTFQSAYHDMRWAMLQTCERAYALGKILVEFSATPSVMATVSEYNESQKKNGRGGTPAKAHCWVAKQFAEELNLRPETLERYARTFLKDQESGFILGPKLAKLMSDGRAGFLAAKEPIALPEPNVEGMADEVADGAGVSLRKPAKAPKAKEPDDELAGLIQSALEEFTQRAQAIQAFASQHRKSLKKLTKNERIERALDRVNAQAELIGFAWVYKK